MVIDTVKEAGGALLRRVGTAMSVFLVASGIPEDLAAQLLVALGAVAGVTFDIGLAVFYRRKLRIATAELVAATRPAPDSGVHYYPPNIPKGLSPEERWELKVAEEELRNRGGRR